AAVLPDRARARILSRHALADDVARRGVPLGAATGEATAHDPDADPDLPGRPADHRTRLARRRPAGAVAAAADPPPARRRLPGTGSHRRSGSAYHLAGG